MVTLICTVRGCAGALAREARRFACANGHSFDVARSGYVNLLQPQDRRSAQPGDSPEAVRARRRFLDAGYAEPLLEGIRAQLALSGPDALLDVGCGEGHDLAALRRYFQCEGHGVDLSAAAIDLAARRHPECQWAVANADRMLPYADGSFAAVASITSRMNAPEFRRVLRPGGTLLVAIPAPDDLIELREAILGEGKLIDRKQRTVEAFAGFQLVATVDARHTAHLGPQAVHDVMASSYRGLRSSQREKLEAIDEIDVTLSRTILTFR